MLLISDCLAQKQSNHWFFGEGFHLDFNFNPPKFSTGGKFYSSYGTTAYSDSSGNLILYGNSGDYYEPILDDSFTGQIFNSSNKVIFNGLLGDSCSRGETSQSALVIPFNTNKNLFYYFTLDDEFSSNQGLRYSIIDMNYDNGNGRVTTKAIKLTDNLCWGMAATSDESDGYWLIVRKTEDIVNLDCEYYAYHIDSFGISTPTISKFKEYDTPNFLLKMKFSNNGKYFICGNYIYKFNFKTGNLSTFKKISYTPGNADYLAYEFSPNNNLLYVSSGFTCRDTLLQFNLSDTNFILKSTAIDSFLDDTICTYITAIQLGSDGKIYVAYGHEGYIGVIKYPNLKGTDCMLQPFVYEMNNKVTVFDFPNFPSSYFRNLNTSGYVSSDNDIQIIASPNPTNFYINIITKPKIENMTVELFDIKGSILGQYSIDYSNNRIDLSEFEDGIYILRLHAQNGVYFKKIIKN